MNLLLNTNLSAYKIAEKVGFADYPNFYKRFKDKVGSSPAKYRRDHMKDYDIMDSSDASAKNNTPPPPNKTERILILTAERFLILFFGAENLRTDKIRARKLTRSFYCLLGRHSMSSAYFLPHILNLFSAA